MRRLISNRRLATELYKRGFVPDGCREVEVLIGVDGVTVIRFEVLVENYFDLPEVCPKCGVVGLVSIWHGPRYRLDAANIGRSVVDDHLEFECKRCGYQIDRPTVDNRGSKA